MSTFNHPILEELLKYYSEDILADDAVFQLGEIYMIHLNDKEKAVNITKKSFLNIAGACILRKPENV